MSAHRGLISLLGHTGGGGATPTAYALLTHALAQSSSAASGATTASKDTTGANLIVLSIVYDEFRGPGVSDSQGNTWVAGTESVSTPSLRSYYCFNPTTSATHTFSVGGGVGGSAFSSIAMAAFSGSRTPTKDQFNNHATGGTTIQPGSVTPTVNNELVVTGVGFNANVTQTIDSGFTKTDGAGLIGSVAYGLALAYKIQTTAVAVSPTWTFGSSVPNSVADITTYFCDLS